MPRVQNPKSCSIYDHVLNVPAGATNHVLTCLVRSFDTDPSAMLTSLIPLPLKSNLRHYALVYLQSAVKVRHLLLHHFLLFGKI